MVTSERPVCSHHRWRYLWSSVGPRPKAISIPFRVFESGPNPALRPQGYRFRVNGDKAAALQHLLTPEIWQRFEKVCAVENGGFGARLDALSGKALKNPFGGGPPPGSSDYVIFGKRLLRYDESDEDVTAFFEDGTATTGAFLVGAQGARSVVRKHYLPELVVLDTECRLICGKTKLTEDLIQQLNPHIMKGMSVLADETRQNPLMLLLEPIRFQDNEMRSELLENYVYWVLGGDKADFEKSDIVLLHMTGKETADLSLKITEKWHPSFRSLLELQKTEKSSGFWISMASPEMPDWKTSAKVTLMGDAAHVMPPTGGVGANTALQDAAALCQVLKTEITLESITKYDEKMRQRARLAISGSAQRRKHLLGMRDWKTFKPVGDL